MSRPQDNVPPEVVDAMSWHDVKRADYECVGLTIYEVVFLDSLLARLAKGRLLTAKQRARLNILLEEKAP